MKNVNKILILFCMIFLVGCSSTKKLETYQVEIDKPKLELNDPTPLELDPLNWHVITKERLDRLNEEEVLFGITPQDYEKMSENLFKLKNYVRQLKDILTEYRNYYEQE